jgi:hypothetical protein
LGNTLLQATMKRLRMDKGKDNDLALRIAVAIAIAIAIGVLACIALEMGIAYLMLE